MANFTKELQFKKYRPLLFKNKNFRKKGNPTNKYFQSKIDELQILSKKKKILFKNCPICKNSKKNSSLKYIILNMLDVISANMFGLKIKLMKKRSEDFINFQR